MSMHFVIMCAGTARFTSVANCPYSCGWWDGVLYRSLIEANVYTQEQYAAGWEVV